MEPKFKNQKSGANHRPKRVPTCLSIIYYTLSIVNYLPTGLALSNTTIKAASNRQKLLLAACKLNNKFMTLDQYIDNINQRYKLGNATEHTFRGDLQQLLESLVPDIRATNEPKRQSCGAPDYILTKKDNLSRLGGASCATCALM